MISAWLITKLIAIILRQQDPSKFVSHRDLYNFKADTARVRRHSLSYSEAFKNKIETEQATG